MTANLTLVGTEPAPVSAPPPANESESASASTGIETGGSSWVHAAWVPSPPLRRILRPALALRRGAEARLRSLPIREDRGAVTAEYVIVVMAGVAFAGLLVAILRSSEIRQTLIDLVQNALSSAG